MTPASIIPNSPDLWRDLFPVPHGDIHKYDRGSVLVAGGAVMTGAARLAARAAQRMGAGLVTLAAPYKSYNIYATALESVIVYEVNDIAAWQALLDDPKRNVILIGPGFGISDLHRSFVDAALATRKKCVLDADALMNFADMPDVLLNQLHAGCVLTPHEGEFSRLFGRHIDDRLPKAERALAASRLSHCTILLKGAETYIAKPDGQVICNTNAPAWLATGGAGDVLAGMIAGLLAQNMPIFMASAAAAWLHGEIAQRHGMGLIAEDIVSGIPETLKNLFQPTNLV